MKACICYLSTFGRVLVALLALAVVWAPESVSACAACFGKSDSPMAAGMNAGIFLLLCVILSVLGGIAAFFIYLIKRSSAQAAPTAATELSQPSK